MNALHAGSRLRRTRTGTQHRQSQLPGDVSNRIDPALRPSLDRASLRGSPGQRRDVKAPAPRKAAGFTLLEILVVVVIIGVIVSAATLAIGVLGQDREVEEQARRFWTVLRQAREEAELQSQDVAVFVAADSYEFLRYEPRLNDWTMLADDPLYAPRALPEGLRFRLWIDGREIVLKPTLPDRSDKQEHEKWPPQIMVLSNGDVMPFQLQIERDQAQALWRIVALPDNDLRVERRSREQEREWTLVARTKPLADDEEDRERVSSARR